MKMENPLIYALMMRYGNKYIEPDSLILYHHGAYEERYKILTLSGDSLIMELYESWLHTEDNCKEVATEYNNFESQIFKFIRNKQ